MKPLVLVTAPVGTRSGYGAHSRDICRSLIDLDKYDVRIWPVRWGSTPQNALSEENPQDQPIIKRLLKSPEVERQPEVHIHIVVPNEFNALGKYNIGITAGIGSDGTNLDTIAPYITFTTPSDDAVGVQTSVSLSLTFNEPIVKGLGEVTITESTTGVVHERINVRDTRIKFLSDRIIQIDPQQDLLSITTY